MYFASVTRKTGLDVEQSDENSNNHRSARSQIIPLTGTLEVTKNKNAACKYDIHSNSQPIKRLLTHQSNPAAMLTRVVKMFHCCLRAVEITPHRVAKTSAPFLEREPPEIFMRTFIMRMSCSARLLVKNTAKSCAKRSTSLLKSRNQRSRLWPRLRLDRPVFALSCQPWRGFIKFELLFD